MSVAISGFITEEIVNITSYINNIYDIILYVEITFENFTGINVKLPIEGKDGSGRGRRKSGVDLK